MKISSSLRTKLAVGAALAALSAISLSGTPTEALTVQLSDHSAEAQKRAEMEQLIAKVNGLSWQGAGGQGNLAQEATIKIDATSNFYLLLTAPPSYNFKKIHPRTILHSIPDRLSMVRSLFIRPYWLCKG